MKPLSSESTTIKDDWLETFVAHQEVPDAHQEVHVTHQEVPDAHQEEHDAHQEVHVEYSLPYYVLKLSSRDLPFR